VSILSDCIRPCPLFVVPATGRVPYLNNLMTCQVLCVSAITRPLADIDVLAVVPTCLCGCLPFCSLQSPLPIPGHLHWPSELPVLLPLCRVHGPVVRPSDYRLHHPSSYEDRRLPERDSPSHFRHVSPQVHAHGRRYRGSAGHHPLLLPRLPLHGRADLFPPVAHVEKRHDGRELQAHLDGNGEPLFRAGTSKHVGALVHV